MASQGPTTDATVGDVFPADDELAQFVIVLCAQRNDLFETIRQLVVAVDRRRNAMHYFHRLVVSHYFEAIKWLTHATSSSLVVADWLDRQPHLLREARDTLLATGTRNGLARKVLWATRKATFHYPQVGEVQDALRDSLEALREAPVSIRREPIEEIDGRLFNPHFEFAEDLMTLRMLDAFGSDPYARVKEICDVATIYVRFADDCFRNYLRERGLSLEGSASEQT